MVPEQVSKGWDIFAPLIERSLPPVVVGRRKRMANVLRAILMEDLEVWVYYDSENNERYVVTTQILTDEVSLSKSLLIYSFTATSQLHPKEVMNGFNVLEKYAKGNDCTQITGYVVDPRVKKFLEEQGAKMNFTFMQIEV